MQTALILKSGNRTFIDRDLSPAEGSSPWEDFPSLAALTDRAVAFGFDDDFTPYRTSDWAATVLVAGTAAAGTTLPGGTATLSATAAVSGQGVQVQKPGLPFGYVAGKKLWFEARLQVSSVRGQFFFGLAPAGTVVSGGVISPADYLGFFGAAGDGVLTFKASKSGGAASSVGPVKTLAAGAWTSLGFVWDMLAQTLTAWVDGVANATFISTATSLPTALLTPSFVCLSDGVGTPSLDVDYCRAYQLR